MFYWSYNLVFVNERIYHLKQPFFAVLDLKFKSIC